MNKRNIDFIGKRKIFFIISGLIILAGLIAYILPPTGLNYDLDFQGGTALRINIGQDFSDEDIQAVVKPIVKEAIGKENVTVQKTGDNKTEVYIRTYEVDTETRDKIFEAVRDKYSLEQEALLESTNVSATASAKLITDAFKAIGLAVIFMLIYIVIRFNVRSGISAVLALIHDILVMLSVYSIFRIPVNTSFVAAVLTIVGYSINDTIVIFDRIRENAKKERRLGFSEVVNMSLNQTIARTVNTSLTTLFTILTLYILGVASIKEFALPIIIGIIVGTYSSMCIASPIWALLREKTGKKNAKSKQLKTKKAY